jgi:hypothetical protein
MNLPDAPIAQEGFFVTHFFTVKDQQKSQDFYVRILCGNVIKPENPCYSKLVNSWLILISGGGPTPDTPEVILETLRIQTPRAVSSTCAWPISGNVTKTGARRARCSSPNRSIITAGNGAVTCAILTATSSRSDNIRNWRSTASTNIPPNCKLITRAVDLVRR